MSRASEMIFNCLKEQGMTQGQLAEIMGEDRRNINQQLHRQNDFKVERFIDVLEHIGYRVEIVENDGIRKVSPEFAEKLVDTKEPKGKYWIKCGNKYLALEVVENGVMTDEFDTKEGCFAWLRR